MQYENMTAPRRVYTSSIPMLVDFLIFRKKGEFLICPKHSRATAHSYPQVKTSGT